MDAASTAFAARVALDNQIKTNADDIAANTTAIANITQSLLNIAVYDGGVYAKDVTRNMWLGPRENFIFGRGGNVKSKYLALEGIFSNLSSVRIDRTMSITSLSANFSAINSGTTYIQLRINDIPVDSTNYLSVVTASGETRIDLNIEVVENDVLSAYVAGDGCSNPIVKVTAAYAVPL